MNKSKFFVLTAVHNDLEKTKKLLACIKKQTMQSFQIIIVDDGSTDETSEYLKKKWPSVTVLKGDGNLWWTGSMYLGVEYILKIARQNDFIVTLNNDCEFHK